MSAGRAGLRSLLSRCGGRATLRVSPRPRRSSQERQVLALIEACSRSTTRPSSVRRPLIGLTLYVSAQRLTT